MLHLSSQTVVVAQLVRASDCGSEGRGFEPHHLPPVNPDNCSGLIFFNKSLRSCNLLVNCVLNVANPGNKPGLYSLILDRCKNLYSLCLVKEAYLYC